MKSLLARMWGGIAGSASMIYAVLAAIGSATIAILVLLLQRNSARSDAKEQKTRADQAEAQLGATRVALDRQSQISNDRERDTDRAIEERNKLAEKDPRAAGDVLSGVLTHPDGDDPTAVRPNASSPMGFRPPVKGS